MKTFNFFDDLRIKLGDGTFTQSELSQRSGVSQGCISKIVHGKTSVSFSTVKTLWPFVYGASFPHIAKFPTPAPAPEREEA